MLLVSAGVASGLSAIDGSGGYAGLSPRFLPTLVALGLGACGLGLIISSLRTTTPAEPASPFAGSDSMLWLLGGLIVHLLLIGWIGFVAASVLLMTCAARGHGSRRPLRDALVALALALPVWWLFARGLGLGLPLFPLIRS